MVEPERPPPQKVELYERVDLPENWKTMDVRAMTTMRPMSRWIRDNWTKGAVILVFCPGQAELAKLHRKMHDGFLEIPPIHLSDSHIRQTHVLDTCIVTIHI